MADCTGFIQPLNLECLLVNTFSGNFIVFTAVAFILISILAARFRMPNIIFLTMIGLFSVLMAQYIGAVYLLVIIITGLVVFYSTSRIVKN